MDVEIRRQDTGKAMAFDLCNLVDESAALDDSAKEEMKRIIKTYVSTANEK